MSQDDAPQTIGRFSALPPPDLRFYRRPAYAVTKPELNALVESSQHSSAHLHFGLFAATIATAALALILTPGVQSGVREGCIVVASLSAAVAPFLFWQWKKSKTALKKRIEEIYKESKVSTWQPAIMWLSTADILKNDNDGTVRRRKITVAGRRRRGS